VIDGAGDFVSGRHQRLHRPELSFFAPIESPEGTVAADDTGGGLPKGLPRAIVGLQGVIAQNLAARNFVVRCQPEPGTKVFLRGEAAQVEPSGWLGLVAFVLSVLGAIVVSTGNMLSIAEFSGVSGAYAVEDFYFTTVPLGIIALICLFGGLLLFGIATLRAGVFPRWAGILLSVGAVVTFFGLSALPPLALLLGIILLATALAWMGWALWSKKGSVESQPKPAM